MPFAFFQRIQPRNIPFRISYSRFIFLPRGIFILCLVVDLNLFLTFLKTITLLMDLILSRSYKYILI